MNLGTAQVIRADSRHLPLADDSVDLVVTSPPYFALRSYQDGGEHYAGQIGDEPTPDEFVSSLLEVTAECMRVLKPSGSLWVNLGDKYVADNRGSGVDVKRGEAKHAPRGPLGYITGGMRQKSLMGIPWRYALRCIDDLGLILRAEVIWCLSGGTRVYARTATGDRPIMLRDLVRAYRPEDVQLWNGERWTQVLGWNKTPDDDGALEFEFRTGERVGCTPGHKWPTQRGVIRADEIRVGDVVDTTRLPEPDVPRNPLYLPDEDIGWLVGLYIAEGSRSGRTVQISGHVSETMRHARLRLIARDLDGKANVYRTSENGATCNLTGAAILGVIDRYVTTGTAKTKRLRASAWQRSDQFLRAVVDGYLSGDGHFDAKNDRWRLGFTANDEWAADLRTLAARTGAKISLRRADHQAFGRTFPGWRGEWRWTRSLHRNAKQDGEIVAIRRSRARDFYDLGVVDEPHTFALASGLLTHNSKPNGLPESVTDRVRRSHEQWFHFALSPRYFSAVDEIREEHAGEFLSSGVRNPRYGRPGGQMPGRAAGVPERRGEIVNGTQGNNFTAPLNPLGKLPGSVWTVPTEPLRVPDHLGVDHFAAFPTEFPKRIIQGWSPAGVCVECGEGRRPVRDGAWHFTQPGHEVDRAALASAQRAGVTPDIVARGVGGYACACGTLQGGDTWTPAARSATASANGGEPATDADGGANSGAPKPHPTTTAPPTKPAVVNRQSKNGVTPCGSSTSASTRVDVSTNTTPSTSVPSTRPAVVLDPFGGTGTTAMVAKALGRHGISVDMSADYCRLAEWRTNDRNQLAKVLGIEKVSTPHEDEQSLFDLLNTEGGAA